MRDRTLDQDQLDYEPDYWDQIYDEEEEEILCVCSCGCNRRVDRWGARCSMCYEACFPAMDYDD